MNIPYTPESLCALLKIERPKAAHQHTVLETMAMGIPVSSLPAWISATGITRLADTIYKLRAWLKSVTPEYSIKSETRTGTDRAGNSVTFAEYRLEKVK